MGEPKLTVEGRHAHKTESIGGNNEPIRRGPSFVRANKKVKDGKGKGRSA